MRIVFMGNPDFAVPSLEVLYQHFDVVGVVTGPDRLGGRGRKELIESAVKRKALELKLPVLQPEKLRDPLFLESLSEWNPDIQVVVAFRMLPEVVWNMPPKGTINLHSSLLPAYRGAAPINWAIINGETTTGLTTFQLQKEIDTGDIYLQTKLPIGPDDSAGVMHDRMMYAGAELLVETLLQIQAGTIKAVPQPTGGITAAPKIFFEDAKVDPGQKVAAVHDFVRGMSPYPGAWYPFEEKFIKILKGQPLNYKSTIEPGLWVTDKKGFLALSCLDGYYKCKEVQFAGKRIMTVKEFLNGLSLSGSEVKSDDVFSEFQ